MYGIDGPIPGAASSATAPLETASAGNRSLRVLQLTDLHLCAEPSAELLGVRTRRSLEQVLARARERHWPTDAILWTGDLVHDERPEAYRYLRQLFDQLDCPCFAIPGNHDRIDFLAAEVDASASQHFRVEPIGAWDLLLLDSTIPGSDAGRLKPETLLALERFLEASPDRPAAIALHHQPVPIGSRWLDTMQVENGHRLIELAERHPQLRLVLWGHVHQTFDREHSGTRLLATPSTCAQFKPHSPDFDLDGQQPGYRWLELEPDGRLRTGVERLDEPADGC
jgi:Icc protein